MVGVRSLSLRALTAAAIVTFSSVISIKGNFAVARDLSLTERMVWSQREQACFRDSVGMFRLGFLIDDAGASFHWRIPSLDVVNVLTRVSRRNEVLLILEIEGAAQSTATNRFVTQGSSILGVAPIVSISEFYRVGVQYWERYSGFKFNEPLLFKDQDRNTSFSQQRGYVLARCAWLSGDSQRPSDVLIWHGTGAQPRIESFIDASAYGIDVNQNGWLQQFSGAVNARGLQQ